MGWGLGGGREREPMLNISGISCSPSKRTGQGCIKPDGKTLLNTLKKQLAETSTFLPSFLPQTVMSPNC